MKMPMLKRIDAIKSNSGQTLVEYALILVLISIVAIVALNVFGGKVSTVYISAASSMP